MLINAINKEKKDKSQSKTIQTNSKGKQFLGYPSFEPKQIYKRFITVTYDVPSDDLDITQFLTDEKLITLSHQDLTDIKASIDELDNPNKTFDFVPNTNYKAQLDDDKFKPRVATVTDEDDNEHYLLYVDYATPKQHTNLRLKLKRS
tara:strand:- start:914 stop:1354 length:441 start_codon:yes stop_codon:yes gene_type:complete